jgi:diaminopimelate decarboxylase
MQLSIDVLNKISKKYGQSFYLLESKQFQKNYIELLESFRRIYANSHIAYSYKTNYIPKLCKLIDKMGGFAEIVSDMEYDLALKIGVRPENIFFNGPYKDAFAMEKLLLDGGIVNIDSISELHSLKEFATKHPQKNFSIGIRCNFDIHDGVLSRFGFDVNKSEFEEVIDSLQKIRNIKIKGLHCHFATRSIETWEQRVEGVLKLVEKYFVAPPTFISLGGGLYGKMPDLLKKQFNTIIPSYEDYAKIVACKFHNFFQNIDISKKPKLIIEPGSALVGDVMKFVTKVVNIKNIRGKNIATLLGSIYNINPTLNKKNLPISIYHDTNNPNKQLNYVNLDFGGYTCIESDYLYTSFDGKLAVGDYVVFENVGSYSVVLKPPFILPNFPIIDYDDTLNSIELIKRKESFEDLFQTYRFNF